MASLKGTETEKNLLKAFAGESQARNRYSYAAKVARKEGYQQIEKLLEEVGEFVAAVMQGNVDDAVMEAGDVAWLLVDILNVMNSKYLLATGMGIALDKLMERHGPIVFDGDDNAD